MSVSAPNNFELIKNMKFGSQWQYVTDHERAEVLKPGYFNNSLNRIGLGDLIQIVCVDGPVREGNVIDPENSTWVRGTVEVMKAEKGDVAVKQIGGWYDAFKKPAANSSAKKAK